jgi:CMP-N,N'-diacetyllegionaminic acid synthase
MRTLAVVPARGGSKEIPRKNLALLHGKPLVAWTIGQALASGKVDYVHLSTDDEEIAAAGRAAGAKCEFLRPAEFAGDRIGTSEAILHAIHELARRGAQFDAVVELQPTYCFRGSQLIVQCLDRLSEDGECASVITCTKVESTDHPDFVMGIDEDNVVRLGAKRPDQFARQFLSLALACKGIVLAGRMANYLAEGTFYSGKCRAVIVTDAVRTLDINGPLDLEIARHLAKKHSAYLL